MTLIGSLYTSMTGLDGYSQALDNLSNNVANLNTPGFKGRDVFFRELGSGDGWANSGANIGQGVRIAGTAVRFTAGDLAATGVETDMAIDGNGLFILREGDTLYYTRAGQFRFDENGFLVDPGTGYHVAGIDGNGDLLDINFDTALTSPSVPTTTIALQGLLAANATTGVQYPGEGDDPVVLTIIDEVGQSHEIYLAFTKLSGDRWRIDFNDGKGSQLMNSHILEFNSDGAPLSDTNSVVLNFETFNFVADEQIQEYFSGTGDVPVNAGSVTPFRLELDGDRKLILRDGGEITYVTAGEFILDQGFLVAQSSGLRLGAKSTEGILTDFDLSDYLEFPAQASSVVKLSGELNSTSSEDFYPPLAEPAINFSVYDTDGNLVDLELRFEKRVPDGDLWDIQVSDASDPANIVNAVIESPTGSTTGHLDFDSAGFALFDVFDVTLSLPNSDELAFQLDFSDNGGGGIRLSDTVGDTSQIVVGEIDGNEPGELLSFTIQDDGAIVFNYSNGESLTGDRLAVVENSGRAVNDVTLDLQGVTNSDQANQSSVTVGDADGRSTGQLSNFQFLRDGTVRIGYSNGDELDYAHIALAYFSSPSLLQSVGDTLFVDVGISPSLIGRPGEGALGDLVAESLELSNVDLSREFADIIIVQRGYQASSQVLNVSNEMIEELYNTVRGR